MNFTKDILSIGSTLLISFSTATLPLSSAHAMFEMDQQEHKREEPLQRSCLMENEQDPGTRMSGASGPDVLNPLLSSSQEKLNKQLISHLPHLIKEKRENPLFESMFPQEINSLLTAAKARPEAIYLPVAFGILTLFPEDINLTITLLGKAQVLSPYQELDPCYFSLLSAVQATPPYSQARIVLVYAAAKKDVALSLTDYAAVNDLSLLSEALAAPLIRKALFPLTPESSFQELKDSGFFTSVIVETCKAYHPRSGLSLKTLKYHLQSMASHLSDFEFNIGPLTYKIQKGTLYSVRDSSLYPYGSEEEQEEFMVAQDYTTSYI